MQKDGTKNNFKRLLNKYLEIKGLDIIAQLDNGSKIEIYKNRKLVKNEIVYMDNNNREFRIPISKIISIDLYAA